MTAEGEFLSGYFAWAFRDRARSVIQQGLDRFNRLASSRGWEPEPVPTDRLEHSLGKPAEPGGIKLEAAIRDLPRGNVDRPGRNAFQRDAFNLTWINLSAGEVRAIASAGTQPTELPSSLLLKLSKALKDCVRGQCSDWNENSRREGSLRAQLLTQQGGESTIRLTGDGSFAGGGRSYRCHLHGRVVLDEQRNSIKEFQLVASGQRTGRDGANDRTNDLGPAPMGVAFKLYR